MGSDRTLDEFLDDSAESGDGANAADRESEDSPESVSDPENVGAEASESAIESGSRDVTPTTPTSRWTPAGEPCAACRETVERVWHDDERFVCADCKEW